MKKNRLKVYPAKVSYGLLLFVFLIFYGPLIPDIINGTFSLNTVLFVGVLTLIFALISYLFLGTRYTIEDNMLKIKCGWISYQPIDINEIKEISKTKNIMASPAPSFDRVEIKYGKFGEVLVSPIDKFSFANDLIIINPNIVNHITE